MPQLSTTHIFMIYLWTWFILYLTIQKTKTILIIKMPTNMLFHKTKKPTPLLPWT